MNFNKHYGLNGKHAFLGASKYHWVNYDEDKLTQSYTMYQAVQRGTELHELAADLIHLGIKLPDDGKTLSMHVNDAIDYGLEPEQILYYSSNSFGTADAIGFDDGLLRIHDLKTGSTKASMTQLDIYAALFCLEYGVSPNDIDMELRIYQFDEITVSSPSPDEIFHIMDKIVSFSDLIDKMKAGE